ncbi:MAG: KTSC domain-containing protein [Flavipsychrobacter sp.]
MKRLHIDSTTINSLAYNPDDRLLEIEFQGGKVYHYYDVPESIYYSLLKAESAGRYFNENIRDVYKYHIIA